MQVRNIFRIGEFSGGNSSSNPAVAHEAYSYAFDAFPMMIALIVLAVVHPGRTLVGEDSEFLSRRKRKAFKEANKRIGDDPLEVQHPAPTEISNMPPQYEEIPHEYDSYGSPANFGSQQNFGSPQNFQLQTTPSYEQGRYDTQPPYPVSVYEGVSREHNRYEPQRQRRVIDV
jgi:hypothetical protein